MGTELDVSGTFIYNGLKSFHDMQTFYHEADVFVLPSLNEGMSNTVLEAMACGLPLIVTDVGGTSELIRGNGFVVKSKNVEDIKREIIKYSEDKMDLIKKHGSRSRELAETMGWAKIANVYKGVY